MGVFGRVVSGKVELDEPLPEGAEVEVNLLDETGTEIDQELEAEILESIAEADRGELIPAEDVLRELDEE